MYKKTGRLLVFLSALIILFTGLYWAARIILETLVGSLSKVEGVSSSFEPSTLKAFLQHPFFLLGLILTIGLGVILVVAVIKMKDNKKLYHWSVISLLIGVILIGGYKLAGLSIIGFTTAGILSTIGGLSGIIAGNKKP